MTMQKRVLLAGVALLLGWAFPTYADGADPSTMTAEDIIRCVEAGGPQRTSVQSARMRVVDKRGAVRESEAKIWWARFDGELSRVLVKFSAPTDLRGSATLVLEKPGATSDMFMYMPDLKRVRRVTARTMSSSVFGTHFSYEDLERLYRMAKDREDERIEDAEIDGRPVFVIESTPRKESMYERVLEYVEKERCVGLKLEFYGAGAEPEKVVIIDPEGITRHGDAWMPNTFRVEDRKRGGSTTIDVPEVEVDVDLDEKLFTEARLARGR